VSETDSVLLLTAILLYRTFDLLNLFKPLKAMNDKQTLHDCDMIKNKSTSMRDTDVSDVLLNDSTVQYKLNSTQYRRH